jgi:hypothetical protein
MELKINTMRLKIFCIYKYIYLLLLIFIVNDTYSFERNQPKVTLHDTLVAPGEILLALDVENFTDNNGQISAITLKISIDTNLIKFIDIKNISIEGGSWFYSYNQYSNEIVIFFNSYSGNGYNIDGKLFDLHLFYCGGFNGDLTFAPGCEFTNIYLQTIQGVEYTNGSVKQNESFGIFKQDTLKVEQGEEFRMPVYAIGEGFNAVDSVFLRIKLDTIIEFIGIENSLLSQYEYSFDDNNVLDFRWKMNGEAIDFTDGDTLFYLIGKLFSSKEVSSIFLPGCRIYSNDYIVATDFYNGFIKTKFLLELFNFPDTAGIVYGGGEFYSGDSIDIQAASNFGFHFDYWKDANGIVSYDSIYRIIKKPEYEYYTAYFTPNEYYVDLVSEPYGCGFLSGDGIYNYGDTVVISAEPYEGYSFNCWVHGEDTLSFNQQYTFIMPPTNIVFKAVFKPEIYTITASPNDVDFGNVVGGGYYSYLDTVTLTAIPNEDYKFVVWTEEGLDVSYDSTYTFVATCDRSLIAAFQYNEDCSPPVGLYADSISYTCALLEWIPSGDETTWDLLWGIKGFDTVSGGNLIEGLNETQYFISELDTGSVYDFYVRAVCLDNYISSWSEPFTFTTWFLNITENRIKDGLKIYPNPTGAVLNIDITNSDDTNVEYCIYNLKGEIVKEGLLSKTIDVQDLKKGLYLVTFYVEGNTSTRLFIKK